ncbi:hypothetical protein ACF1A9_14180 [Streptomyces sp. NPDC014872]|uniref:hypothetical protein n=1 Tax=Streptomyces sp. NPDC014872 TaxID=3364926 RepID=UPI0036FFB6D4
MPPRPQAAPDIEPVFLPTYGSWLNWMECEFAALRHLALNGTDHRSHDAQNAAIAAYRLPDPPGMDRTPLSGVNPPQGLPRD